MRRLVIFVIETKSDKENSDGVYLRYITNVQKFVA